MKESVIIKSNAYGIIVNMDKDVPFDTLLSDIGKKFKESAKFFKNAKMGISFKGRELTDEQERAILNIISENSGMEILCVVDNSSFDEQVFKNSVENKVSEM